MEGIKLKCYNRVTDVASSETIDLDEFAYSFYNIYSSVV